MTNSWPGAYQAQVTVRSESKQVTGGTVTLFEGATLCNSGENGDIEPGGTQGLFGLWSRLLSCYRVLVDGESPVPLGATENATSTSTPYAPAPHPTPPHR